MVRLSIQEIDALVAACRAMSDQLRGSLAGHTDPRLRKLTRQSSDRYSRLGNRLHRIRPTAPDQVLELRLSRSSGALPEASVDSVLATGSDPEGRR